MALGTGLGWLITHLYYRKQSGESQDTSRRLDLVLLMQDEEAKLNGRVHTVHRDDKGKPVGIDATVTPEPIRVKIDLPPATPTGDDAQSA